MTSADLPLIRTKMHPPTLATTHVHRQHLLDLLDEQIHRPLTLVSAPAGYGKSTLMSRWLEVSDLRSAWLSIDHADNDLRLFVSYLLAAVQTVIPGFGREIGDLLQSGELPPLPVLRVRLINDLDAISEPIILVLDDYHVIDNPDIHELLDEVLKHPPDKLHLALISRNDPPLPLSGLRAKGQITEIRARDLKFSRTEIAEFLQLILGQTLDESIVATFEEKSEGWITGLHLAALSLSHKGDVDRVRSGLPEDNRFVMDYLVAEILAKQPQAIQDFLLKTSIVDRFCASLCDAICFSDASSPSHQMGGQEFLQLLKQANLFSVNLDEQDIWYRYHHLFRNLLKKKLHERFEPQDINELHAIACTWFEDHAYFEDALEQALTIGDVDRAAEITGRGRHSLMNNDQWQRLERWLKLFSQEAVQENPQLILLRCWLDYYYWYRLDYLLADLDRADVLLASSTLHTRETDVLKAEAAALRSNLTYWLLEPSRGVALAEQALRDVPDEHECVRSTALMAVGALHQLLGKMELGEQLLWTHMEDGRFRSPSSQCRLVQSLCIAGWPTTDTRKLRQSASRLLQISTEYGLSLSESYARYFLGLVHYEQNELEEAVAQLEIVVGDPYRFPIHNVAHSAFLLSLSYQAAGLSDRARRVSESISTLAFERGNQLFIGLSEAFQAYLDLLQGRIAEADQWARNFTAPGPHTMQRFFNAELTNIRVMLVLNTPESLESAADQLDSLRKVLDQTHHRRLMIDILGMEALLADALGQETSAFERLSEAIFLAEPNAIISPFLELGDPMADLLKRFEKHHPDRVYVEKIIDRFRRAKTPGREENSDQSSHQTQLANQSQVEPLTNRELDILTNISDRLSNQEIADKASISPETVKRHLYNIYQKFDVNNRQQAVAKGKSLGIL